MPAPRVIQDTRGRFASEGEREPRTYEQPDGCDSVRWAAALPPLERLLGLIDGIPFGNIQWRAALSTPTSRR
ncbi:CocE/NonD family hydrolase [Streptomyces sp. NPDC007863]|uniref:CocE/NonD family hydrolase n=1 Tax=Streptomyces sp. NPDC007863 TaxID=3154894 RepID=UPI0033F89147